MANGIGKDHHLPAFLSVWDAVSIIIGIVIGTGIFETVPFILGNIDAITLPFTQVQLSPVASVMIVWALAGLLSLVGGLCYAELGTSYPYPGGDVVYLTRAYGRWLGFLFGYAQLAVVLTANIGMMAYVFADYAVRLFHLNTGLGWLWAGAAVIVLTFLNVLGIRTGKSTQNVLTVSKVLGLMAIILVGLFWPATAAEAAAPANRQFNLPFAMVLIMLTYGGWNDAAYVAGEVRDKKRGIPRALILGILAVTLIYLLVNFAYLNALGYQKASQTRAIAADVLGRPLGAAGDSAMCLLVMISALGAANGLIFTGARVSLTLGRDHPLFAWLGHWHGARGAPVAALITQAALSLGMIAIVGSAAGQSTMNDFFAWIGSKPEDWAGSSGFTSLLKCTAPVFWMFFLLTGLSLFILREQQRFDATHKRVFSSPFYPYLPLAFCLTCGYMLDASIKYAGKFGLVGTALLLFGLPLFEVSERMGRRRAASD